MFAFISTTASTIGIDTWALVLGVASPFFTAVATKVNSGDATKGLVSISYAAFVGVFGPILSEGSLDIDSGTLVMMRDTWLTGLVSWLGLTSDWTRRVNEATAAVGLGRLFNAESALQ